MVRFSKNEMSKMASAIRKNIKAGKGYLASVTAKDMDGKSRKLTKKQYMGLFEAQNVFLLKNGRYPNYTTLNSSSDNPVVIDYQNTAYNCCPTSFSMATQFLFDYKSEQTCVKALGTVQGSGTDPSKLVANAPKLGYTATRIKRNWKTVKSYIDKGYPVIAHIQTKPAHCLGFSNDYGHYILIHKAYRKGFEYYSVADPTKGIKVCKASVLDKATNGRDIGYYVIKIK